MVLEDCPKLLLSFGSLREKGWSVNSDITELITPDKVVFVPIWKGETCRLF